MLSPEASDTVGSSTPRVATTPLVTAEELKTPSDIQRALSCSVFSFLFSLVSVLCSFLSVLLCLCSVISCLCSLFSGVSCLLCSVFSVLLCVFCFLCFLVPLFSCASVRLSEHYHWSIQEPSSSCCSLLELSSIQTHQMGH